MKTFYAKIDGLEKTESDVLAMELARTKKALYYLREKIGKDNIKKLLADNISQSTRDMEEWVAVSNNEWKSQSMTLFYPSCTVQHFLEYFLGLRATGNFYELQIAHPEHFYINVDTETSISEIVECLGEDENPWHIFGGMIPNHQLPCSLEASNNSCDVELSFEFKSPNNVITVYSNYKYKNVDGGMEMILTIILPEKCPDRLLKGHMNHFSIEYRNWLIASTRR